VSNSFLASRHCVDQRRAKFLALSFSPKKASGFTLIELLVAAAMLAFILIAAERAITTSQKTGEISERRAQQLRDLDRVWIVLENDLRNAVSAPPKVLGFAGSGQALSAMQIDTTDSYRLSFLRAGQANPLGLGRTEVLRVAYRVEDEILWRDSWVDPYNPDPQLARPQQLIDNIESFDILALPKAPAGRSVSAGPWLDAWPQTGTQDYLPLALELTLRFKDERELKRLITLTAG